MAKASGQSRCHKLRACALLGCLLLGTLLNAEAARQGSGWGGKAHSSHGHPHAVVGISQGGFLGDVLPEEGAAQDWGTEESGVLGGFHNAAEGRGLNEQGDTSMKKGKVFEYVASFLSTGHATKTGVNGADTNCHLSHDVNSCTGAKHEGGGRSSKSLLAQALKSLKASDFSGASKQILPAGESAKPAEIDPTEEASELSLAKPSEAGKKILPAHEGTKPAELNPANHKAGQSQDIDDTSADISTRTTWAAFVPRLAHAFADVVATSAVRHPSADGKRILPADEGRGIAPGTSAKSKMTSAYADTRARMLLSAGSPATSTVAQLFVDAHNAARTRVGVAPMRWNSTLAVFAQQWANYQKINNSCAMAHRPTSGPYKRIYGENIAWNGGFKSSADQTTNLWTAESAYYNRTSNTCIPGKVCGHYTAIVWAKTTQMGCAVVACPDPTYRMTQFWVCNYWPNGNIVGQRPY